MNICIASASKFIVANKLGYKIYQSIKLHFSYYWELCQRWNLCGGGGRGGECQSNIACLLNISK